MQVKTANVLRDRRRTDQVKESHRSDFIAFACKTITSEHMSEKHPLSQDHISEIVQMALSDHVRFQDIQREYGLSDKEVKALMRNNLKAGSYRAWRKRVRDFGDRRAHYK